MKKLYMISALAAALAVALTIVFSARVADTRGYSLAREGDAQEGEESGAGDGGENGDAEPPQREGAGSDAATQVRVLEADGTVSKMALGEYLVGVVAGEMPAAFEPEALRAQAVAARTMALYRMEVEPNPRHPDADVCADPACCMAYDPLARAGWSAGGEYTPDMAKIIDAVRSTDGVWAAYGGEPILAVFHSSSAGRTENSGDVWGGELPYLVSVDSPETPGDNPGYTAAAAVTADEFRRVVTDEYADADAWGDDPGTWISDVAYTAAGRIAAVKAGGVTITGGRLRAMFGLKSTAADIEPTGDGFIFVTRGSGHGVGMSQYGANAMAASGAGYADILRAYYTGIEIKGA
ncbi:MAG: stage II sporulation protein D [Oscillospiraceae bacterium]|nr:stage II sporulation protein D [Oscillospiraceae bacterium]